MIYNFFFFCVTAHTSKEIPYKEKSRIKLVSLRKFQISYIIIT